ncbi:MAG: hypothetical protein RBS35_06935, partial [Azonexus sp.]|nr:hypothetical protein [Azonexus sp.]
FFGAAAFFAAGFAAAFFGAAAFFAAGFAAAFFGAAAFFAAGFAAAFFGAATFFAAGFAAVVFFAAAGFLAFFSSAIVNLHCMFEERMTNNPPTTARIIQQRRRTGIDEFMRFHSPSLGLGKAGDASKLGRNRCGEGGGSSSDDAMDIGKRNGGAVRGFVSASDEAHRVCLHAPSSVVAWRHRPTISSSSAAISN